MYLTLLVTLVLPAQQSDANTKTIQNATSLVENDWWENQQYMLSLHPTKKWDEGVAWFFRKEPETKTAWKGGYRFFAPKDDSEDLILLRLSLTREYHARTNWGINTRFEPKGVLIEIPLKDNTVPDALTMSVTRAFFVDSSGNETTKRYAPSTFLEKLAGEGQVKQIRRLEFLDIGQTLRMKKMQRTDYSALGLDKNPPPGYRIQKTQINSASYKEPEPVRSTKPRHEELHELAVKYHEQKEYDKAIQYYTAVILIEPKFAIAYRNRAAAYQMKKEHSLAIADYTEALKLEPRNVRAYIGRAWNYERIGDYPSAVADYRHIVQLDSKNTEALKGLAWNLATCPRDGVRDGKKAVEYAKTACQLTGWKDPIIIDTLAAAYAEAGDFRKAVMWQSEAFEMVEEKHKEDFRSRLVLFEEGKPYRTR